MQAISITAPASSSNGNGAGMAFPTASTAYATVVQATPRRDLEFMVLSAMVGTAQHGESLRDALEAKDFEIPGHATLFDGISMAYDHCKPGMKPDALLVHGQIQRLGSGADLQSIRDMQIGGQGLSKSALEQMVQDLIRLSDAGRLRRAGAQIHTLGDDVEAGATVATSNKVGDMAEQILVDAMERNHGDDQMLKTVSYIADRIMDGVNGIHPMDYKQIMTGYSGIDSVTMGIQASRMWVMAALSHTGKTSVAMNIMTKASLLGQVSGVVFTFEQGEKELTQNMISMWTGPAAPWVLNVPVPAVRKAIHPHRIREISMDPKVRNQWYLTQQQAGGKAFFVPPSMDELMEISNASHLVSRMDIVVEAQATGESFMRRTIKRMDRTKPDDKFLLAVLDYLQISASESSAGSGGQFSKTDRASSLTAMAKQSAMQDMGGRGSWIVLSQFNRQAEQAVLAATITPSTMPGEVFSMSFLRDSGTIENDADVIWFMLRPDRHMRSVGGSNLVPINLSCMKNRQTGDSGNSSLIFNQTNMAVVDLGRP